MTTSEPQVVIGKAQFLSKRTSASTVSHKLPDGDVVPLRPLTPKIYRAYKRSLRDKDGVTIPERQAYQDELLVGRLLCNADGSLMFSDEDILTGAFDDMDMPPITSLVTRAYEMMGVTVSDEDREKNSPTTDSTEQS